MWSDHHYVNLLCLYFIIYSMEILKGYQIKKKLYYKIINCSEWLLLFSYGTSKTYFNYTKFLADSVNSVKNHIL